MGRNLIVCTDGTWNTPDQMDRGRVVPSNVVKIARATSGAASVEGEPERPQLVYYDSGVGTGGRWDRIKGGIFGVGLSRNVTQAYEAIGRTYQPGDRLFLFGFSRGAYTARSLAGLIGLCGIPNFTEMADAEARARAVAEAYAAYRTKPGQKGDPRTEKAKAFATAYGYEAPQNKVWFVGVWDTVGALGVPVSALSFIAQSKHSFHDPALGPHIRNARHAMAIDERRKPFAPSLWSVANAAAGQTVEQLWFPGAHSNVGGGYVDSGISDRTLLWMCLQARDCGMGFREQYLNDHLRPNYHGEVRDSMSAMYKVLGPHCREIGSTKFPAANEALHFSAVERYRHATQQLYRDSTAQENLGKALGNTGSVTLAPPMNDELHFHEPGYDIGWNEKANSGSAVKFD